MADTPAAQNTTPNNEGSFDDIFNVGPAATSIVTPATENQKQTIFSRDMFDLDFLNTSNDTATKPDPSKNSGAAGDNASKETTTTNPNPESGPTIDDLINETNNNQNSSASSSQQSGKSKTDRSVLNDFFKKQIEGGHLFTFDDFDEKKQTLDEYLNTLSPKDLEELWNANHQEYERKTHNQVSQQLFEALPKELQYAYKYVADGGTDLKGLFKALSQSQEVRELSIDKPEDHEAIYRQYLNTINFGTPEEIDEEVHTWKDLGQLDKKAKQAKPKLDKLQEQVITRQLEQQETLRKQNEDAARLYVENVYKALEPGTINGLKLDKKTQAFLYNAMVSAQYPSISGKQTNLLGHLLEKYQYVEPNYPLITEALWLLSDPQGYRSKLIETGATQETAKTVRALKTEESRKLSSGQDDGQTEASGRDKPVKISRQGNIFKR